MRDPDETWARLIEYRSTYGTTLQALIDYLLAPAGFWGHSAEDSGEDQAAAETAVGQRRDGR